MQRYAFLALLRLGTFYMALSLFQVSFDGQIQWLNNLWLAAVIALLVTYVQFRISWIRKHSRPRN